MSAQDIIYHIVPDEGGVEGGRVQKWDPEAYYLHLYGHDAKPIEDYRVDLPESCTCKHSRFKRGGCKHITKMKEALGPKRAFTKSEAREITNERIVSLRSKVETMIDTKVTGFDEVADMIRRVDLQITLDESGKPFTVERRSKGLWFRISFKFSKEA